MNSVAHEPLKGCEHKLTQILTTVERRSDLVLKVMGQRSRSRKCSPVEAC